MNYKNYNLLDKQISFLILDFSKPAESKMLLLSLSRRVKLDRSEIIFYSNDF
jgi:hypothetical protein